MPTNPLSHEYGVGLACRNGHALTGDIARWPEDVAAFCGECGAPTVSECDGCHQPLRGLLRGDLIMNWAPDRFCYACGASYPWIAAGVAAGRELIAMQDKLSGQERADLDKSFDDLIRDTPRSSIAVVRMKLALGKVAGPAGVALREVLTQVATAQVKRGLGL